MTFRSISWKVKSCACYFNADVAVGRSHAGGPGWYVLGSGYDGRWRPPDHTHHARLARHCKLNGTLRLTRTSLTAQLFLTVDYISLQTCALCNSVRVQYTSAFACRWNNTTSFVVNALHEFLSTCIVKGFYSLKSPSTTTKECCHDLKSMLICACGYLLFSL